MVASVALAAATVFSWARWPRTLADSRVEARRLRSSFTFSPAYPAVAFINSSASWAADLRSPINRSLASLVVIIVFLLAVSRNALRPAQLQAASQSVAAPVLDV